jgi:hypothetical protein
MPDLSAEDPLALLVLSYLDDLEIELRPQNLALEPQLNTWHYSIPEGGFDPSAVSAALQHVARQLSKRSSGQSGTFYCWYDEQAGQIRLSLSSRPVDQLPFGGRYRSVPDADEVLQLAIADQHPGVVLWEELAQTTESGEAEEAPEPPFAVWTASIP